MDLELGGFFLGFIFIINIVWTYYALRVVMETLKKEGKLVNHFVLKVFPPVLWSILILIALSFLPPKIVYKPYHQFYDKWKFTALMNGLALASYLSGILNEYFSDKVRNFILKK